MHSHCGEDVLVTLGNFDGQAITFDRSNRAHWDHLAHAGSYGAHRGKVAESFASVNGEVVTIYLLATSSACQMAYRARLNASSSIRGFTRGRNDAKVSGGGSPCASSPAPGVAAISPEKDRAAL